MSQTPVKMFLPFMIAGVVPAPLYRFVKKEESGVETIFEFSEVIIENGKIDGAAMVIAHVFSMYFDEKLQEDYALYTHEQLEMMLHEFQSVEGLKMVYKNPAIDFQEQRVHN